MKVWTRYAATRALVAGGLLLPVTILAQAQKCEINDNSPYQINGARQYVIQAASSRKPDEVPKHLANAIRVLTDSPEKIKNEPGRQYLLLRTYAQYLQAEGAQYVMKRGTVGFTTNPQGNHNLLLAVDSAATVVETLMPQCKATVAPYRLRFFGDILNKSVTTMNADKNDSASYYAHLALQVSGGDPRPWNVLSAVYQKQNFIDSAMMAMGKVIELSGADTLYKKVKQQSRYNLAVLFLTRAEQAKGEGRDRDIKQGRGLLEEYLKDSPGEANATQALGRALRLSGDTAAVKAILGDMVDHPEKFTDVQLFEAASNASAAGRDHDAAGLFESGLKKNPYHRVALLNLSNVLFQLKDAARMGPIALRLIEVDPNSPDSWRMHAGYWQLRQRAETDPAKKKAFGDSTLSAIARRDKVNPHVTVFLAGKSGNAFQLQGSVSNETDKAGSWTIKFELLDAKGAAVASKDVAVGPVDAGASTTFSVKVDAPTAIAYRYAPIK